MRSLSQDPTEADKSLIPFDKLGLQKVLYPGSDSTVNYLDFAPPEPELAVPFLSLVALKEGFVLPASTVSDLYTTCSTSRPNPPYLFQPENGERPLPHPRSRAPLASRDLRKAVMQLQSELQWLGKEEREGKTGRRWQVGGLRVLEREKAGDEEAEVLVAATEGDIGERTVTDDVEALKRAAIAADALSASDALIERRTRVRLEVRLLPFLSLELPLTLSTRQDDDGGRFTTASDAEITLPILEQLSDDDERLQLPSIGAEPAMAHAILSLSAKIWGDALRFGDVEDEGLEEKRYVPRPYPLSIFQLTRRSFLSAAQPSLSTSPFSPNPLSASRSSLPSGTPPSSPTPSPQRSTAPSSASSPSPTTRAKRRSASSRGRGRGARRLMVEEEEEVVSGRRRGGVRGGIRSRFMSGSCRGRVRLRRIGSGGVGSRERRKRRRTEESGRVRRRG